MKQLHEMDSLADLFAAVADDMEAVIVRGDFEYDGGVWVDNCSVCVAGASMVARHGARPGECPSEVSASGNETLYDLDYFREGLTPSEADSEFYPIELAAELRAKRAQFADALDLEPPDVELAVKHLRELSSMCQERGL